MRESAPGAAAEAARAALAARRARMRARRVWSIPLIAAVLALTWWSMGPIHLVIVAVVAVLAFAWQWWSPAARTPRLAVLPDGAADVVECYRQVLETEVEALHRVRSLWPSLFWCFVALLVLVPLNIAKGLVLGEDLPNLRPKILTMLCLGLVFWQGWRSVRRDLPRVEAEREAFDRQYGSSPSGLDER